MLIRASRVGVALGAMLTVAAACSAADLLPPGKAGIGGLIGVSTFKMDRIMGAEWFGDYSEGAQIRFAFYGQFRYVFKPWFRVQVGPGFTWAGYDGSAPIPFRDPRFPDDPDKREYLTCVLPVSLQAQYLLRRGQWIYHAGIGPGIYRVWVQNNREVLKDPVTLDLHRGLYGGFSSQLGAEYFLKDSPSTSVEITLGADVAYATRDDQFPSGWNSSVAAMGIRVGANYYFDVKKDDAKKEEPAATPPNP